MHTLLSPQRRPQFLLLLLLTALSQSVMAAATDPVPAGNSRAEKMTRTHDTPASAKYPARQGIHNTAQV